MSDGSQELALHLEQIEYLHSNWTPHTGEIEVGRYVFDFEYAPIEIIFVQCGRKWGKTEMAIYMLYRHSIEVKDPAAYYFSPFQKQSKEILWANKRLQDFAPDLVADENNSELRLKMKAGGFIKVDGSDNLEASRGITPTLVIYDEFKDFKRGFHKAMAPNLASRRAKLVIFGTPPEVEGEYNEMADYCKSSPTAVWVKKPTSDNPYIDKQWLGREKDRLYAKGEGDVWEREYMANMVKGGARSIFPMFTGKRFVRPHDDIIKDIKHDLHKLSWFVTADPGTTTCFAVLFGALNPYTKKWYLLDEIYERETAKTSVNQIWPRIDEIRHKLLPPQEEWEDKWTMTADEAAAWFINETLQGFSVYFQPTQKAYNKKENGISLIKDILLCDLVEVSDRCEYFIKEMENYIKDDNDKIPKKDDHQIDNWRYKLGAAFYKLNKKDEPGAPDEMDRRGTSIEEDFPEYFNDNTIEVHEDLFEDYDDL